MKKKDIAKEFQSLVSNLHLDELDLGALKEFKFKRKAKKGGKKKWAVLALAAIGAAVAYKALGDSKSAAKGRKRGTRR